VIFSGLLWVKVNKNYFIDDFRVYANVSQNVMTGRHNENSSVNMYSTKKAPYICKAIIIIFLVSCHRPHQFLGRRTKF